LEVETPVVRLLILQGRWVLLSLGLVFLVERALLVELVLLAEWVLLLELVLLVERALLVELVLLALLGQTGIRQLLEGLGFGVTADAAIAAFFFFFGFVGAFFFFFGYWFFFLFWFWFFRNFLWESVKVSVKFFTEFRGTKRAGLDGTVVEEVLVDSDVEVVAFSD
jgi:hypothetical protein